MARRKAPLEARTNKTCRQITDLVYDYLRNDMAPSLRRDFERHLRLCPDCVSFLNTYRATVRWTQQIRYEEIPDALRRNALEFLRRRISKSA